MVMIATGTKNTRQLLSVVVFDPYHSEWSYGSCNFNMKVRIFGLCTLELLEQQQLVCYRRKMLVIRWL